MPGIFDRIKDTTTYSGLLSVGTSFTVANTPSPVYQSFRSRYTISDANIPVAIVSQSSSNWMICWCTYTALDTLRVDTIIFTSNTVTPDAAVTFSGTSDVFVTASSRAVAGLREANTFTANNYFTTGNVGIGTSAPGSQLHVVSATNFQPQIIADHVAGAGTGAAYFVLDRARGTPSARTAVVSGDTLGTLMARGHDGSAQQNSAWISFDVDGAVSAGNVPTGITLFTTPVGGSTTSRMHIDADGNVGIGTTGPSDKLVVYGTSATAIRAQDATSFTQMYTNGGTGVLNNAGTGSLQFWNNGTERVRIDGNGNVGINTSSPINFGAGYRTLELTGTTGGGVFRSASSTVLTDMYSESSLGIGVIRTVGAYGLRLATNSTERMHITSTGEVGVGTNNPVGYDAKLAVFNGNIALTTTTNRLYLYYASATNHAYLSAAAGGEILFANGTSSPVEKMRIDTTGQVGIGGAPNTKLDVQSAGQNIITSRSTGSYAAFSRNVPTGQPGYDFCIINGVEVARITWSPSDILTFHTGSSAFERLRIDGNGNVGINVATSGSSAKLTISTTTNQLTGTAASTVLSTNAGALGTTAGNELALASIGFTSNNQSMLGIRAIRSANGTDWTTSSIGLSMDVDNTVRAGGGIWFSGNGQVGIGITAPESAFQVARNAASETAVFVSNSNASGYPAVRFGPSDRSTNLDALIFVGDRMGLRSGNRPLVLETGSGSERMRIHTSGGISFNTTNDPGTGVTAAGATFRINRFDTSSEGGELQLCRASDNNVGWSIDLLGAGTGTDPTTMRFVDQRTPAVRLELNSRGQLTIVNDLGPISTDTQAVGFRGSPNNDLTGAYTLTLTDAGRTVRKTDNTARTVTVPADGAVGSSTNFPIGTCIMLCNVAATAASNLSVQGASASVTIVWMNGTGTRTPRTTVPFNIAFGGSATLRKVAANLWALTGAGIS